MRRLLPSQNRELPIETNLSLLSVSESVVNLLEELSEAFDSTKIWELSIYITISTRHVYTFEGMREVKHSTDALKLRSTVAMICSILPRKSKLMPTEDISRRMAAYVIYAEKGPFY